MSLPRRTKVKEHASFLCYFPSAHDFPSLPWWPKPNWMQHSLKITPQTQQLWLIGYNKHIHFFPCMPKREFGVLFLQDSKRGEKSQPGGSLHWLPESSALISFHVLHCLPHWFNARLTLMLSTLRSRASVKLGTLLCFKIIWLTKCKVQNPSRHLSNGTGELMASRKISVLKASQLAPARACHFFSKWSFWKQSTNLELSKLGCNLWSIGRVLEGKSLTWDTRISASLAFLIGRIVSILCAGVTAFYFAQAGFCTAPESATVCAR